MSLDDSQTLVLNADYRPVSYFPLSLWSWQMRCRPCSATVSTSLRSMTNRSVPRARR